MARTYHVSVTRSQNVAALHITADNMHHSGVSIELQGTIRAFTAEKKTHPEVAAWLELLWLSGNISKQSRENSRKRLIALDFDIEKLMPSR